MKILMIALALALVLVPLSAHAQSAPRYAFFSLEVADMARAKAFYSNAIGMKEAYVLTKPTDPVQKIALNFSGDANSTEPMLILIHTANPTSDQNKSSGAKIGFGVSDNKAATDRARAAGYSILAEPKPDHKGPAFTTVLRDPDGVIVELVELRIP